MGRQINFYIFPSEVPQIIDIADEVGLKPVIRALRNIENNPDKKELLGQLLPLEVAKSLIGIKDVSLGFTLDSLGGSLMQDTSIGNHAHLDTDKSEVIEFNGNYLRENKYNERRLYLQSGYYDKEANWIPRSEDLNSHYQKLKRRLLSRILVKRYFRNYLVYMTKSIAQGIDDGKIELSISPSYIKLLDGYDPQG